MKECGQLEVEYLLINRLILQIFNTHKVPNTKVMFLTLPIDIGKLIGACLEAEDVNSMQLACKRTKRYTDEHLSNLFLCLPGRRESIRWVVSCIECAVLVHVDWYIPMHPITLILGKPRRSDIPRYISISSKTVDEITVMTSYLGSTLTYERTTLSLENPRAGLEQLIPKGSIINPSTMVNIMLCRGVHIQRAVDLVSQFRHQFCEQSVAPITSNIRLLYERMRIDTPPSRDGPIDIDVEDLVTPCTPEEREEVYWLVRWNCDYPMYVSREIGEDTTNFTNIIDLWHNERHMNEDITAEKIGLIHHGIVISWLVRRMKRGKRTKVRIYIPSDTVVVVETIGSVVLYRAYKLVKHRIIMTQVPESCLLENILRLKHFPGMVDHATLFHITRELGIEMDIRIYILNVVYNWTVGLSTEFWNNASLLTKINTYLPLERNKLHRVILLAHFWMPVGTEQDRIKLLTSTLPSMRKECILTLNLMAEVWFFYKETQLL